MRDPDAPADEAAEDPYGSSISHVARNLAACRDLGVKFGPGYLAQPFKNIDQVWTLAGLLRGDHRLRYIGRAPEPRRACQHPERDTQGKRTWCTGCESPARVAQFTP